MENPREFGGYISCPGSFVTNTAGNVPVNDPVNHPHHYTAGGIECIDAIEASMTPEGFAGFCKGNVMKYIFRYEKKNGLEDLKKADWYLDKLIAKLEAGE